MPAANFIKRKFVNSSFAVRSDDVNGAALAGALLGVMSEFAVTSSLLSAAFLIFVCALARVHETRSPVHRARMRRQATFPCEIEARARRAVWQGGKLSVGDPPNDVNSFYICVFARDITGNW